MWLFLILIVVVHTYAFWLRNVYFYRKPTSGEVDDSNRSESGVIHSLVEGRVVYVKVIERDLVGQINKMGRILPLPEQLRDDRSYVQIGVFMTPMNNHHLTSPGAEFRNTAHDHISGVYNSMWDRKDNLLMFVGKWFIDWWDKKLQKFIAVNARTRFYFYHGIIADLIYDKYVNKITFFNEKYRDRELLAFVHRGSQVDLFIPMSVPTRGWTRLEILAQVGDRVKFDTKLAKYSEADQ